MSKIQNTKNNEKMSEYCKTCICKSCEQLKTLEQECTTLSWFAGFKEGEVEKLKAENDRLKEEIKEVKKYQYEQEYLEKEIERLKQTLQEIKEYAEIIGNEEMISGYAIRAKSALWRIANKITKAEEE